jgi:leucyl-tRNA synthetase
MQCDDEQLRVLHQTIRKVTDDTQAMSFNTAIAKMMEFSNHFTRCEKRPRAALETFLILLNPYAPHLCEELWSILGHTESIALQPWPVWDEAALAESSIEIPVQINGKLKAKIHVPPDATADQMIAVAIADEQVVAAVGDKQIVKKIGVPGRMVNLVVK